MALPPSGIVTVRLAPADAEDIDALVATGRFTSRSDFLRHAVRLAVAAARDAPRALAAPAAEDAPALGEFEGPGALAAEKPARAGRRAARKGIH